jgi:hypothetical protein
MSVSVSFSSSCKVIGSRHNSQARSQGDKVTGNICLTAITSFCRLRKASRYAIGVLEWSSVRRSEAQLETLLRVPG